jgi:Tol biopolymer transport system component
MRLPKCATLIPLVLIGHYDAAGRQAPPQQTRLEVNVAPAINPSALAISPDGDKIVYSVSSDGKQQLWLHSLATNTSRALPGTDDVVFPAPCWSPDSKSIGYFGPAKFKVLDITTGSSKDLFDALLGNGCSWNRDGTILFGLANGVRVIFRVSEQGGTPQPATSLNKGFTYAPHFLPDGRHFLYYVLGDGVYVGELGGTQQRLLASDASAVYSPSGHILFLRNDTLYAQKFDADTLTLGGEPIEVAHPISMQVYVSTVATSAAGHLVYRTGLGGGDIRQFKWFDRTGKEVETVADPFNVAGSPAVLSSDGRYIAVDRAVNGTTDIWLLETRTGKLNRITEPPGISVYPVFSPKGPTLYYASGRTGPFDIFERSLEGTAEDKYVMPNRLTRLPREMSADGRFLLFRGGAASSRDIWAIQMDGNPRGEFPVVTTPGADDWPSLSPDSKWVAYQSDESGKLEVYIQPFPSGSHTRVSVDGGFFPRWSPEGKEVFYLKTGNRLMAAPIEIQPDGQEVKVGTAVELFKPSIFASPTDGLSGPPYLAPKPGLFLISTIRDVRTPITVIKNWQPGR